MKTVDKSRPGSRRQNEAQEETSRELEKPASSKLTPNLMLKMNTQNTMNRAYIWLKLFSVVIDNICAVRKLYKDLSDSPFSETI